MKHSVALFSFFVALSGSSFLSALACGCGGSSEPIAAAAPAPALDDGSADGAADDPSKGDQGRGQGEGDASDAGAACTTIANVADELDVMQVAADPPTLQGGTIADGTYVLTDATVFTGAGGPEGASGKTRTTLRITGTHVEQVTTGPAPTRSVTLVTDGATFTSTNTCPDTTTVVRGSFTATPTTLVVRLAAGSDDAGARTLVETFTKR